MHAPFAAWGANRAVLDRRIDHPFSSSRFCFQGMKTPREWSSYGRFPQRPSWLVCWWQHQSAPEPKSAAAQAKRCTCHCGMVACCSLPSIDRLWTFHSDTLRGMQLLSSALVNINSVTDGVDVFDSSCANLTKL